MNALPFAGWCAAMTSFYTDREAELDAEWSAGEFSARIWKPPRADGGGALRGLRTASLLNVVVAHSGCLEAALTIMFSRETLCQQVKSARFSLAFRIHYFDSLQGEQWTFSINNVMVNIHSRRGGYALCGGLRLSAPSLAYYCIWCAGRKIVEACLINVTHLPPSFQIQLYASLLLQVFSLRRIFYGWYAWSRQNDAGSRSESTLAFSSANMEVGAYVLSPFC